MIVTVTMAASEWGTFDTLLFVARTSESFVHQILQNLRSLNLKLGLFVQLVRNRAPVCVSLLFWWLSYTENKYAAASSEMN